LGEAATSIRRAALAVRQPPQPKRRGRKLVLLALAGAGAAVAFKGGGHEKLQAAFSDRSAEGDQDASAGGAPPPPPESKAAPVG
jgi:hypothetical protein